MAKLTPARIAAMRAREKAAKKAREAAEIGAGGRIWAGHYADAMPDLLALAERAADVEMLAKLIHMPPTTGDVITARALSAWLLGQEEKEST